MCVCGDSFSLNELIGTYLPIPNVARKKLLTTGLLAKALGLRTFGFEIFFKVFQRDGLGTIGTP